MIPGSSVPGSFQLNFLNSFFFFKPWDLRAFPPPFSAPGKSSPRPCKSTKNKSRNSSLISTCEGADEKGRLDRPTFWSALKSQKKERADEKEKPHMKKNGIFKNYSHFFWTYFWVSEAKRFTLFKERTYLPSRKCCVGININQGKLKIRWITGDCLSGASSKKGNMKRLEASVGQKETCSQSHLFIQPSKKTTGNNGIGPQHASRGVPRMRISWVTSQGRKIQYRNTIKLLIRPLY